MNSKNNDIIMFFNTKVLKHMAPLVIDKKISNEIYNLENIKCNSIKYPYKPFLLLSIINAFKNNKKDLFKSEIDLHHETIIKSFYDLITKDNLLFLILKNHSGKQSWEIGFNENTKSSVFSIMLQRPIKKLESKWFIYDNKTKKLKFNFDIKPSDENFIMFESLCFKAIKEAKPWYKEKTNSQIINLDYYYDMDKLTRSIPLEIESYRRRYQHIFRKFVLDRDKKCIICCLDNNSILEACHIKPYSNSDDYEKYDPNNGITLCSNHHKLFDKGYFSFDENWNLIITNKFINNSDDNLYFRQYEKCYTKMLSDFPSMNNYAKYHFQNVFIK